MARQCCCSSITCSPYLGLRHQLHDGATSVPRNSSSSSTTAGASSNRRGRIVVANSSRALQSDEDFDAVTYLTHWGPWHTTKLQAMLKFMGPAAAIPLADPLMSFVDAVSIGQFGTTMELGALGPASVIFSFCQYIFGALQVTQLSMSSSCLRKGDRERAARLLTCGISIAIVCGLVVTLVLQLFGGHIVAATGVRDVVNVLPLSTKYVSIRSWAQPAVLLTMACQAGLLAQGDAVTPMLAVLATTGVSALGNVIFLGYLGWGLVGAALTTVITQYFGALAMLVSLLQAKQVRPARSLPLPRDMFDFLKTMGPLTISYLCKNLCYVMINTTAAMLENTKLAAHQAAFSLWTLFSFAFGPVEPAAISNVPAAKSLSERRATTLVVYAVAAGIAVVGGSIVGSGLTVFPQLITRDAALWPSMAQIAVPATFSLMLTGMDSASTGINISLGDSHYLARSYIITLAAMFGYITACRSYGWGLTGIWYGVVCFFGLRAIQSVGRVTLVHLARAKP